jgi:uncharacterized protein (DUF2345 family)
MRNSYSLKYGITTGLAAFCVLLSACTTTAPGVLQPGKQDLQTSQLEAKKFGRKFRLMRPADNRPVANRRYEIVNQDGTVVMAGVTDEHGETGLYETDKPERVSVRFAR